MSALATLGTTGLTGTGAASHRNGPIDEKRSSEVETLYSDKNRRVVHLKGYDDDFFVEIDNKKSGEKRKGEIKLKKADKSNISASDVEKIRNISKSNGSVEAQVGIPDLKDVWNPGYEFWTDVMGNCPAIPFDKDYTWGLAVDTGLPSLPGYAADKIETLAIDILCQVIQGDAPKGFSQTVSGIKRSEIKPSESNSSSEIEPQITTPDPRQVIAAVIIARGCKWALSPLVGALANGAATGIWYDCHDPSNFSEFTAVCQTTSHEYVTEAGKEGDGFPAVPGAHYGLEVEYWKIDDIDL